MTFQRRYQRVAFFREVTLRMSASGETLSAHSFDASLGGVGLVTMVFLERGEAVGVGFHLKNVDGQPVVEEVLGRIAYCRADESGNLVGVEFVKPVQSATYPELTRTLLDL